MSGDGVGGANSYYYKTSIDEQRATHYQKEPSAPVRRMWVPKTRRPVVHVRKQATGASFSPDPAPNEDNSSEAEDSALLNEDKEQSSGALFSPPPPPNEESNKYANTNRSARFQMCHTVLLFLIVVTNCIVIAGLYSDSRMLEDRLHRVDKWMNLIDQSHLLDVHLPNTMEALEAALPLVNQTTQHVHHVSHFADDVTAQLRRDHTVDVAHNLIVETREMVRILNHTLEQGRLTFQVPLGD